MREEIEFEAFAQYRVRHVADAALPGGAGIRDDDVDPAETADNALEGSSDGARVGNIADPSQPGQFLRRGLGFAGRPIEQGDLGAFVTQGSRGRQSDRAGAAGHYRDLAGGRVL